MDLWPDNWPALNLYLKVNSQWRTGFNGPVALDYNVVLHLIDRMRLSDADYDDLLGSMRVIEKTACPLLQPKR